MSDFFHISFAKVTAPCPYCGHVFSDRDDFYVTRMNKNKDGLTRTTCKICGERVGLTYDTTGQLVAFDPNPEKR